MSKILVIDDEQTIIENLKFVLELEEFEVISSVNPIEGIKLFNAYKDDIDAVICDMKMPRMSGLEVLSEIKSIMSEMSVIILTGHGDMENAIQSMKEGAYEYLRKPINADELLKSIIKARENKNLLLENARIQSELKAQNIYLKSLSDASEKILQNLMPGDIPNNNFCRCSARYLPAEDVGGDMYDSFDIGDYICSYVFDVSSHGILATVIAVLLKSFFENMRYNFLHNKDYNPGFPEIISDLNYELLANSAQYTFASLFICFLEKSTRKLLYISSGHPVQYMFNDGIKIVPMKSTGTLLGVFKEAVYRLEEIQLKPGDKLLLFSDGILEAANNNILYGQKGVREFIASNKNNEIEQITAKLLEKIINYSSQKISDDITILGIEVH